MKKGLLTMAGVLLTVSLVSAGTTVPVLAEEETTLVYGSGDYTRINPAMDEHGEINILIFNGLTAHDGDNQVVPGLAESWDFDDETNTYTFHMAEDAKWQDGEPVTAEDVKFTIEAIMDPENGSENAPNYEDVEEINVIDDHTVAFKLEDKNVAFLDYMTMAVLPKHLLEGEDMQTSDFFLPGFNFVWACSYRVTEEIRSLHILSLKQMLRKNCHCHIVKECNVLVLEFECNCMIIDHIDLFYVLVVRCILRTIFWIHDSLDGKFNIVCCNRFAILLLSIFCHMECVGVCCIIKIPAFCQSRNYLIVSVMCS